MTIAALFLALVFFTGCQTNLGKLPVPNSQAVQSTSGFAPVVEVLTPDSKLCSGTFISPRAVLTASHCLKEPGTFTIVSSFGVFYTDNKVNFGPGVVDDPNDIAIIFFDQDVADPHSFQVAKLGQDVQELDIVTLVGFGCTDLTTEEGAGTKRVGTNAIYAIDDYIELLTPDTEQKLIGPSNRAGSCFGDSGGFLGTGDPNGQLTLLGVTHAGGGEEEGEIESQYIDMTRSDNRNFVSETSAAFGLSINVPVVIIERNQY